MSIIDIIVIVAAIVGCITGVFSMIFGIVKERDRPKPGSMITVFLNPIIHYHLYILMIFKSKENQLRLQN